MGKILVEKLLRSCPGIGTIYILVRTKRGVRPEDRIKEYLDSPIFGLLKNAKPNYQEKVVAISGDATKAGLGMSAAERALITKKVSIIFHAAATVRFDETLAIAVSINVNSVREIINISRECDRFKAGVYVSTAYSFCPFDTIKEKLYPAPMTYDESNAIVRIIEKQDWSQKRIATFTESVIGKWPNTYSFTKAIAEGVIADEAKDLPFCIYRPSIALASYKEPLPGYTDNLLGVNGVVLGMGLGVFHVMCLDGNAVADVIPVDMACNALIACAWATGIKKVRDDEVPVYNYVSGTENPITWNRFRQILCDYADKNPSNYTVYYYTSTFVKSYPIFILFDFFVHYLPAVLVDLVLKLMGRKPMLKKLHKKGHKVMRALLFFTQGSWTFENFKTQSLWNSLSESDKNIFGFNMKSCSWTDILKTHGDGMRKNILKEERTPENTKKALRKMKVLYVIHQAVRISFVYFVLWSLWKIFSFLWN
ncbi:fatty acyl-CoA reductase wat-like isoform X2 [Belonocnema kinseyi]|nr:fatty acyl-CoA reductase wat-like isoform X2 [Belonocnema kinseyi]